MLTVRLNCKDTGLVQIFEAELVEGHYNKQDELTHITYHPPGNYPEANLAVGENIDIFVMNSEGKTVAKWAV